MGGTAVEHIASAIAAIVLWDALTIREAEHLDHQRALGIVLREGGRTVLRMGLIGVPVCCLIAIGTTGRCCDLLELRHVDKAFQ